jgi:hypothetical protein
MLVSKFYFRKTELGENDINIEEDIEVMRLYGYEEDRSSIEIKIKKPFTKDVIVQDLTV